MYPYHPDEVKRRAWFNRLIQVKPKTKRERKLKDELIDLLSLFKNHSNPSEAIFRFNQRRKQLLSPKHHQGLSWEPHSGFFWGMIKLFIGWFVKIASQASALRQAIDEEKSLIITSSNDDLFKDNDLLTTDYKFEQAMYQNPTQLFETICHQIDCLTTSSNHTDIGAILERLYALRLGIQPMDYFKAIQKISTLDPKQTLCFFYKNYDKNQEAPNDYEFLELHLMAQILMGNYVCQSDEHEQHIYKTEYLLILMNEGYFDEAIEYLQGTKHPLDKDFDDFYSSKLAKICPKENDRDKPHEILKTQLNRPNLTNPLSVIFAKLALEKLLLDYHADRERERINQDIKMYTWNGLFNDQQGKGIGFQAIYSLSSFLKTWKNNPSSIEKSAEWLKTILFPNYFGSYHVVETNTLPHLICDLKRAGITDKTKKMMLQHSENPSERNWIIERLKSHFSDELIQALLERTPSPNSSAHRACSMFPMPKQVVDQCQPNASTGILLAV